MAKQSEAIQARMGVSQAETNAFLNAQNKVTSYLRKFVDASGWFLFGVGKLVKVWKGFGSAAISAEGKAVVAGVVGLGADVAVAVDGAGCSASSKSTSCARISTRLSIRFSR